MRGNPNARMMIIGDQFSVHDSKNGKAFSGVKVSNELRKLVGYTQFKEPDILYTNIFNEFFPKEHEQYLQTTKKAQGHPIRGLYPQPNLLEAVNSLHHLIEKVQPEIIVGCSDLVSWALTHDNFNTSRRGKYYLPTGMTSWHGSQIRTSTGIPYIPVYHPQDSLRIPQWHEDSVRDFSRINKLYDWDEPTRNFIIAPTIEHIVAWLTDILLEASSEIVFLSCDIETFAGHISCIGFGTDEDTAMCIPLTCKERPEGYFTDEEEVILWKYIRRILTHPNIRIIGQNFLYDAQYFFFSQFFKPYIYHDTMFMQHLYSPVSELSLVYLSNQYCRYHRYWKEDGKIFDVRVRQEDLWTYNCRDCAITFEACMALIKLISHAGLQDQLDFIRKEQQEILTMMCNGVAIDQEEKAKQQRELLEATDQYEQLLDSLLPEDVYPRPPKLAPWYRSPTQQREIFTKIFGLKRFWNNKKKAYTMDDAALEYYGKSEPILNKLTETMQKYNSLKTFKTFTSMKTSFDGRMRCSYNPTATTFRYKSSSSAFGDGGNLQNLPKGQEV